MKSVSNSRELVNHWNMTGLHGDLSSPAYVCIHNGFYFSQAKIIKQSLKKCIQQMAKQINQIKMNSEYTNTHTNFDLGSWNHDK